MSFERRQEFSRTVVCPEAAFEFGIYVTISTRASDSPALECFRKPINRFSCGNGNVLLAIRPMKSFVGKMLLVITPATRKQELDV